MRVAEHWVSQRLAASCADMPSSLPVAAADMCHALLVEVPGLCVAARNSEYPLSTLRATAEPRVGTLIGPDGSFSVATAALCNGTAAHGEDGDETVEGGPVDADALIAPALLAAGEQIRHSERSPSRSFTQRARRASVGRRAGGEGHHQLR